MVSFKRVLPAVVLGMVALPAFADSFSFSVSGSTQITLTSPNDNFWGDYESNGNRSTVNAEAPYVTGGLSLANLSFFLPAGSTITSASLELILPATYTYGTSVETNITQERLPPPDTSEPVGSAPTFDPGTAYLEPFSFVNGRSGGDGIFDLTGDAPVVGGGISPGDSPVIGGNEVSTGDLSLELSGAIGGMEATVATQGDNYSGYVGGTGEVSLPYTLEVVGDYTVTPEPAGIVLLGTGMLALLAGVWWRRTAGC